VRLSTRAQRACSRSIAAATPRVTLPRRRRAPDENRDVQGTDHEPYPAKGADRARNPARIAEQQHAKRQDENVGEGE
jgi:hypothetical protein